MIITTDAEKAFYKIQLFFMKTQTTVIKEKIFNMIIVFYQKSIANIILNGKRL